MLKSPRIKTLSWFDIVLERKSENCKIKFLLLGGRYTRAIKRGESKSSVINCTSKLEKLSQLRARQLKVFLNSTARPPPRPEDLGALKKLQSLGHISTRVSVSSRKSSPLLVAK